LLPRITKRRLWWIVALAIFVLGASAAVARADETPVSIDQYKQRLDIARATLDEVSKALAESGASADALRVLRERVAPLPGDLDDVVQKLAPRLTAIDARLKELSGPGAAASPAPAATEQAQKPAPAPSQAPPHKPTQHGKAAKSSTPTKHVAPIAVTAPAPTADSAAALDVDLDAVGAGVQAVLHQLLDDRGGPLDHFPRGNLIDELVGKNTDGHGAWRER